MLGHVQSLTLGTHLLHTCAVAEHVPLRATHVTAAATSAAVGSSSSSLGTVEYKGLPILRCIQGESCDILFAIPELQARGVAALLESVNSSSEHKGGDHGTDACDESKAFLEALLGCEGTQEALTAMLQGVHHK